MKLGSHLIIEGTSASLYREPRAGYIPVSVGTEVQIIDKILPKEGQPVKILCSDFSLKTLEHEGLCPCKRKLYDKKGYEVRMKMGANSQIPYTLHPRLTAITDPEPVLKWYDTGASSYTVEITDIEGNEIWQDKNVMKNQIRYPGNIRLQAKKDYLLWVKDNDTGEPSGSEDLKFWLLDDKTLKAIEAHKQEIQAMDLSKESKIFAIAVYYATQGVHEEALSLLDSIKNDLPTPALYLWRGYMYGKMRLYNEAKTAYTQALELAVDTGEKYIQAEANDGLWCVTRDQAYHDAAMKLYNELGESEPKSVCENKDNKG